MSMFNFARSCVTVTIAMISLGPGITANADEAKKVEINVLRGVAKYEDPYVAVRDLYLSTVGCVHYDGTKMDVHTDYPKGRWAFTSSISQCRARPIR